MGEESVADAVDSLASEMLDIVRHAYEEYYRDREACGPSSFLPLRTEPGARSIALTARFGEVFGCKWVSSIPSNPAAGLPRAHATLILNEAEHGRPIAVMAASPINYARTAASAVLYTTLSDRQPDHLTVVGCGPIGRTTLKMGFEAGWSPSRVTLVDPRAEAVAAARQIVADRLPSAATTAMEEVPAEGDADLVVLASSQTSAYVFSPFWTDDAAILNLSLRDLGPTLHGGTTRNVTDDRTQALGHGTSLGEAVRLGHVDASTIDELSETLSLSFQRSKGVDIFSPFGLGILDVAVAASVLTATG